MRFLDNIFLRILSRILGFKKNSFHPLVWINGDPKIGRKVHIGGFSEVNAKGAKVIIGDNCDIASFVAINAADSHKKCLELDNDISRKDIIIENNVFIGTHSVVLGGASIGHHTVISAGSIVRDCRIPPFSLVINGKIKEGYYKHKYE